MRGPHYAYVFYKLEVFQCVIEVLLINHNPEHPIFAIIFQILRHITFGHGQTFKVI